MRGPLITESVSDRGDTDSVFVFTSRRDSPVTLMIDQLRMERPGSSRHALAPLCRAQAARIAWHLFLAALTPGRFALEQDDEAIDTDEDLKVASHA